ncbi:Hypothetical protein APM_0522 [Acidiphilium sp. PM]|nr:Hypothetical protein APM_0522 [Acidiphilium sp. PM]
MMLKKLLLAATIACAAAPAAHAGAGPLVLGTAANPPKGPGPGKVFVVNPATRTAQAASFAKAGTPAGNSFYAGYDAATRTVFVPSPIGRITMLNAETGRRMGAFPTIKGARVARVLPRERLLVVLSAKTLAAYSLAGHQTVFTLAVGGNALATNQAETELYVGGNMDRQISVVALPSGRVVRSYPVARSGDLVTADGQLFSADMMNGVMSVIDTVTGTITQIRTPEIDPHFSYAAIPHATAGFMQLATSPDGNTVYAAGFSGHILKFSAQTAKYLGEIAVRPAKGMNQLSGLAVLDHGKDALVTVENRHEAALVSLRDGKVSHLFKGVASNRWIVAAGH